MPLLSKVIRFWNNLFRRQQMERDLNDELLAWVEEMVERMIQAGFTPETAREAALLELGGMDRVKDLVRQQRIGFRDLRKAGVTVVVAIVAFVSGASAAAGVFHWKTRAPIVPAAEVAPGEPAPSAPHLPVLEGRIVDNATGQPIPFVEVAIKEIPIRRFTYTDDTGHFDFLNPPESAYLLEAGPMQWPVSSVGSLSARYRNIPREYFEFPAQSKVSVKSKDGRPMDGELINIHGGSLFRTPTPAAGTFLHRFRYDSSVLELRAENLLPGKLAER